MATAWPGRRRKLSLLGMSLPSCYHPTLKQIKVCSKLKKTDLDRDVVIIDGPENLVDFSNFFFILQIHGRVEVGNFLVSALDN